MIKAFVIAGLILGAVLSFAGMYAARHDRRRDYSFYIFGSVLAFELFVILNFWKVYL